MILRKLLERLEYEVIQGDDKVRVTNLAHDTREGILKGSLFVCVSGTAYDGHAFAGEASRRGAAAIVAERPVDVADGTTVILVKDARYALALISAAYFGYPAKRLCTIGVTGTKGKTTTTYMIRSILERAGYRTGLIGTIETIVGDKSIPAKNSTPESFGIHKTFKEMADAGCDAVVMEVSSQGLMMRRTAGILFDIGVFTNLGEDHIGPNEHKDFEDYMHCKSLLFKQCKVGIGNADDGHFKDIFKEATCRVETFGFSDKADIYAGNARLIREAGHLKVGCVISGNATDKLPDKKADSFDLEIGIPGIFNIYNALAAISVCRHFHVSNEQIREALLNVKVKGRIEMVKLSDRFTILIDYAHNAMSLKSLLKTLREYNPKRLVCLFGCGGNRARARRYEMGEVSGNLADLTIITSDNPRFEKPEDIIEDIKTGIRKTPGKYIEIPDRREAVRYAVENAMDGDVIVLAGKGHEDYQEICGVKYPMDERVMLKEIGGIK